VEFQFSHCAARAIAPSLNRRVGDSDPIQSAMDHTQRLLRFSDKPFMGAPPHPFRSS
jgi:hypothetical protein